MTIEIEFVFNFQYRVTLQISGLCTLLINKCQYR